MDHDEINRSQTSRQDSTRRDLGQVSNPGISGPQASALAITQRVAIDPYSLTPADVMQLQKTLGNEAVGRLIEGMYPPRAAQPIQAVGEVPGVLQQKQEVKKLCIQMVVSPIQIPDGSTLTLDMVQNLKEQMAGREEVIIGSEPYQIIIRPSLGEGIMQAVFEDERAIVEYNPAIVSESVENIFFILSHEIAHLFHSHPKHAMTEIDATEKEFEADTTALLNMLQQNYFEGANSIDRFGINLVLDRLHPSPEVRGSRFNYLRNIIKEECIGKIRFGGNLSSHLGLLKVLDQSKLNNNGHNWTQDPTMIYNLHKYEITIRGDINPYDPNFSLYNQQLTDFLELLKTQWYEVNVNSECVLADNFGDQIGCLLFSNIDLLNVLDMYCNLDVEYIMNGSNALISKTLESATFKINAIEWIEDPFVIYERHKGEIDAWDANYLYRHSQYLSGTPDVDLTHWGV